MVKIFIGNLLEGGEVGNDEVRPLFEAHGTVTECEVMKNHGYGYRVQNKLIKKIKQCYKVCSHGL